MEYLIVRCVIFAIVLAASLGFIGGRWSGVAKGLRYAEDVRRYNMFETE